MSSLSQKRIIVTLFTIIGILSSIFIYKIDYYHYSIYKSISFKDLITAFQLRSLHNDTPTATASQTTSLPTQSKITSAKHLQNFPDFSDAMAKSAFKFIPRLSSARGYAEHGWLRTYHTFSFANYYNPTETSYGPLRVINEDNIQRAHGFDTHHHREFEIFTYITRGEVVHKDSLGNTEVLKRGDVQYTSAGTGISHSEYAGDKSDASILQIWVMPNEKRLKPTYYTRHHTEESKTGILKKIIAPREVFGDKLKDVPKQDGKEELIPIPADLEFYASILKKDGEESKVTHKFGKNVTAENIDGKRKRLGMVHLVMSSGIRKKSEDAPSLGAKLRVTAEDGTEALLSEGDGLKIEAREGSEISFESVGGRDAEFVFFDMAEK